MTRKSWRMFLRITSGNINEKCTLCVSDKWDSQKNNGSSDRYIAELTQRDENLDLFRSYAQRSLFLSFLFSIFCRFFTQANLYTANYQNYMQPRCNVKQAKIRSISRATKTRFYEFRDIRNFAAIWLPTYIIS